MLCRDLRTWPPPSCGKPLSTARQSKSWSVCRADPKHRTRRPSPKSSTVGLDLVHTRRGRDVPWRRCRPATRPGTGGVEAVIEIDIAGRRSCDFASEAALTIGKRAALLRTVVLHPCLYDTA